MARPGLTRRRLIGGAALVGVGAGLDRLIGQSDNAAIATSSESVTFYGAHQAGIATPAQDYLYFAAFDLAGTVDDLRTLLEQWTAAAAALTAGERYLPTALEPSQAPVDTGEAVNLGSSQLTLTFGFGPDLLDTSRGLGGVKPRELQPLPPFLGESLDPASSGGDICVQACADDPQVAFHAVHELARIGGDTATLRWSQQGFGRTSSTSRAQSTPRNLMGFKDGTNNVRGEDTNAMNDFVWVKPEDGPAWMIGGTYLITRRIKILFDVWDTTTLEGQQRVIGREKLSGAPIGSQHEYDPVNLQATGPNGELLIPANAHIRLASASNNDEQRILRRGYSYGEPVEPGSGQINAGLFFIAFQRSPTRQFIPLQRRLAASDTLNRHTLHTASAIFACPPSVKPGGFIGEELFT